MAFWVLRGPRGTWYALVSPPPGDRPGTHCGVSESPGGVDLEHMVGLVSPQVGQTLG